MCGHKFEAGELGPGTIVGSAAFNMFVIIGICVWTIPNGESRKIKHLRVFFITAFWSIFAYIWLYLILSVMTPGVVDVRQSLCGKKACYAVFFSLMTPKNDSRWGRADEVCAGNLANLGLVYEYFYRIYQILIFSFCKGYTH